MGTPFPVHARITFDCSKTLILNIWNLFRIIDGDFFAKFRESVLVEIYEGDETTNASREPDKDSTYNWDEH
jgi:hypothetical protein